MTINMEHEVTQVTNEAKVELLKFKKELEALLSGAEESIERTSTAQYLKDSKKLAVDFASHYNASIEIIVFKQMLSSVKEIINLIDNKTTLRLYVNGRLSSTYKNHIDLTQEKQWLVDHKRMRKYIDFLITMHTNQLQYTKDDHLTIADSLEQDCKFYEAAMSKQRYIAMIRVINVIKSLKR